MEPSEYNPFAPEVHDYVDGRLSAEAERDFERRLQSNTELKGQVESLKRSIAALGALPVLEPKAGFSDRVIGRIREDELADRARKQIASAPVPLWQHVVQVGLGAAAAAVVFAVIGMPGMLGGDPELEGSGGGPVSSVAPTEDDLLPAMADHNARFESLRRNVAHTRLTDPNLQRQVIVLELEYSDLQRRNGWLSEQVAALPSAQRQRYQQFLADIDSALAAVSNECLECQRSGRDLNTALVNAHLAGVRTPGGAVDSYMLSAPAGTARSSDFSRVDDAAGTTELMLYAEVRLADYRHDHESVIKAADSYLRRFDKGLFEAHAKAATVAAHLRLGSDETAAREFVRLFDAKYDEDLSAEQLELIRGLLSASEVERLVAARRALKD
jgi:hypothetical protein